MFAVIVNFDVKANEQTILPNTIPDAAKKDLLFSPERRNFAV